MNTPELTEYYADLLIKQYVGKPKAYATIQSLATPILMPQVGASATTWVEYAGTANQPWVSIAYGLGKFVAVSDGGPSAPLAYSTDGISWTHTPTVITAGRKFTCVTFGNGLFVACAQKSFGSSDYYTYTSTDGINWTEGGLQTRYLISITYMDGLFVVAGYGGQITTSPDGLVWTPQTSGTSEDFVWITNDGTRFIATLSTNATDDLIWYSIDGISWHHRDPGVGSMSGISSIAYGNGTYIVSGAFLDILTSTDLVQWEEQDPPASFVSGDYLGNCSFGGGVFVINTTKSGHNLIASSDGVTWTDVQPPITDGFWSAQTYGDGKYVIGANNGKFAVSLNDMNSETIIPLALTNAFTIETAVGVQLDTIGKYLGVTRYGYDFSAAVTLSDADFRNLLYAVIARRALKGRVKDIQEFIHEFFPDSIAVQFPGNMHMAYLYKLAYGLDLMAEYFIKLGLLPRPCGIGMVLLGSQPSGNYFGFANYSGGVTPGASPMNTYSNYATDAPWLSYNSLIEV